MHTILPALLALGSALLVALGTVIRHRASVTSGIGVLWWVGAVTAVAGFVLQAAALATGPVLLVQPIIVLAVAFAIPMDAAFSKVRIQPGQWLWAGLLVTGVAAFVVFARPVRSKIGPQTWILALVVCVLLAILVAMVVHSERSPGTHRALLRGTVAGSMFGIAAVLVNALGHRWEHPVRLLGSRALYLLILVALIGLYFQQRAFLAGAVHASFPALTIAELLVSMALGLAILGEKFNRHTWATAVSLAGLTLTVIAVLRLARYEAPESDEPDEPDEPDDDPRVAAADATESG